MVKFCNFSSSLECVAFAKGMKLSEDDKDLKTLPR